ncbi:MAG: hypothetical protein SLAVMIC_00835 [uncultured marine phage]|uniref:Uncharacterized protein n=1 Tax=uncultured marine phage TaxID=707152 RepID=A0A8D9CEV7_9VIRU|nr:MAG: hypothetical protein SLAVMIC_00835 [uncultured marine phage]
MIKLSEYIEGTRHYILLENNRNGRTITGVCIYCDNPSMVCNFSHNWGIDNFQPINELNQKITEPEHFEFHRNKSGDSIIFLNKSYQKACLITKNFVTGIEYNNAELLLKSDSFKQGEQLEEITFKSIEDEDQ